MPKYVSNFEKHCIICDGEIDPDTAVESDFCSQGCFELAINSADKELLVNANLGNNLLNNIFEKPVVKANPEKPVDKKNGSIAISTSKGKLPFTV